MEMMQCALCKEKRKLLLSHIVPKFVFKYLKKTSVASMRSTDNPNLTVQDGEKHYLLCSDCEKLFNKYETKFANEIFYPYMEKGIKIFDYDSDLYYFLTSLSWRSLYLDILDFIENAQYIGIDSYTLDSLQEKEMKMRNYLLNKQSDVLEIENHIFFFEDISRMPQDLKKTKPHATMHRSVTSYTFFNKELKTQITLTNMMGIVLFTIYNKSELERLINTEIVNGIGTIKAMDQHIKGVCGNEIVRILEAAKDSESKTSDKQKEIIYNRVLQKKDEFTESKAFKDLQKDFNL